MLCFLACLTICAAPALSQPLPGRVAAIVAARFTLDSAQCEGIAGWRRNRWVIFLCNAYIDSMVALTGQKPALHTPQSTT